MSTLFRLVFFLVLLGITKAHHIRLVLLALLGLAGIWFLNGGANGNGGKVLANISNLSAGGIATRIFSKRSIDTEQMYNPINWEQILKNDPASCARSFVCQLATLPWEKLSNEERTTLHTIRTSKGSMNWANKQLYIAMTTGLKSKNQLHCRKVYRKCPYSHAMMLQLMTVIQSN